MDSQDFFTVEDAANLLGISTRRVRYLAEAGVIKKLARGIVDRDSVDRYDCSMRGGRTRSWAEHTAWGAVALLAGERATWLGQTQESRLRGALRAVHDAHDLVTRLRNLATTHTYGVHQSVRESLQARLVSPDLASLGISVAGNSIIDGYLPTTELDSVRTGLHLVETTGNGAAIRTTSFDMEHVARLVRTEVTAAISAATSADPRLRDIGRRALDARLAGMAR